MSELDRFKDTGTLTLEEFNVERAEPVGVNGATAKQRASYTAVLSNESAEVMPTYNQVKTDMATFGSSDKSDRVSQELQQNSIATDQVILRDLISDQSIPFEEKKAMAFNLLDRMNGKPNLRNQVSEKALVEESINENAEMETVRINTGAIINEVNETKRQREALVNSTLAASNPTTMDTVVDFAEYLVPFVESKRLQTLVSDYRNEEDLTTRAQTFADIAFLTGSDKKGLINALRSMSPSEQLAASQALVDVLNSSEELLLPDENDLAKADFLRTFLEDGYYTTTDEWIDNVVSLLDLTILAKPIGSAVKLVKSAAKPTSLAKNLKDTNPGKARAMHSMANADESDEVAQATYGTTRTEAVADDLGFEIAEESGEVENKVGNIGVDFDKAATPDAEVMDIARSDGQIYYWEDEKRQARSQVYNDFRNPTGLRLRNEMTSVGVGVDDGAIIRAIYGPTDSGFATAQDAIDTTLFTFRKYGLDESNVELMMQRGDKYVPVPDSLKKTMMEGNVRPTGGFLARVNYKYDTNPLDIEKMAEADVKWNLFDRIPGAGLKGQGTLQRHMLDAHSMLHPNITKGASVAVDKAAGLERNLLDLGKRFTDKFTKLPKDRQLLVEEYVKEANDKGIDFNFNRLVADGYQPKEIEALQDWRKYWDTVYELENRDLGKTLRNQGYGLITSKEDGTRMIARPSARQTVGDAVRVYDPVTGEVKNLAKQEIDDLYAAKGTVAKLKNPTTVDDEVVEFVLSREDASSYIKGIKEGDQVLNKRKGYYSVQYTAPKFIVERVKDKNGKVLYEKAVAMAGNTADADLMARRMATTKGRRYDNVDPEADFFVRENVKGGRIDSEDYWSLQAAGGRSAQRIRGKRLEDASGSQVAGDQNFVMGPVDSLIHSARNISRRVPMREYLDATKQRFMQQYKHVLPKDEFGQVKFPNTRSEIGATGRGRTKLAADARTTFEYIKSLEDGYINGIDEAYKATLKFMANILGNTAVGAKGVSQKALSKAEGTLEGLSELQGPTGFGKNIAFQAYLASNPLRQLLVQGHQSILTSAVNPNYHLRGALARDLTAFLSYVSSKNVVSDEKALEVAAKASGRSGKEFKAMYDAWQRSGMGAAVDKSNLIRGSLSDMANYGKYGASKSVVGRAVSPLTTGLHLSRQVGFDAGEYYNSLVTWLTYADKVKQGKKGAMTQKDWDEVTGSARNLALNMNQAGEMPYNQNTLGLFFQFMQVPHKMLTTISFNRTLPASEKAKLASLNFLLFGVGGTAVYNMFDSILPEDQATRDAVTNGLEGFLVNSALTMATGEETRIDFSSLAPTDMYGLSDFITSLWTENPGNILAASPSGQLFFGNNPRITNAFKRAAQYFHLMEDSEDPVELDVVFKSFAQISSGYSAAYKAKMAYTYGQKRNAFGGIVDENVSTAEAMAAAFGFGTLDERDTYLSGNILYEDSQAFEEDFKKWYKDMKLRVAADGVNPEESEYALRIMNAGLNVFQENQPKFQQLLRQQLRYDIEQNKDYSMYRSAIRAAGFMDKEEREKFIRALPFEDEATKENILEVFKYEIEEEQQ